MNKTIETITGLKPVIDYNGFDEALEEIGIHDGVCGTALVDAFIELLQDRQDLCDKAYHYPQSWHNLLFYGKKFRLAYDLQYISKVYFTCRRVLAGKIGYYKGKYGEFMKELEAEFYTFGAPCQLETYWNKKALEREISYPLSDMKKSDYHFLPLDDMEFPLVSKGVWMESFCRKIIPKSEVYIAYRAKVKRWYSNLFYSCLNDASVSETIRLYEAGDAMFGLFFHSLIDADWTLFNEINSDKVARFFNTSSSKELKAVLKELKSQGRNFSELTPILFRLMSTWQKAKNVESSKRVKCLKEINRCTHQWLKKTVVIHDGKADQCLSTWDAFLIKYLLQADLEINDDSLIDFLKIYQNVLKSFPSIYRVMEKHKVFDKPSPENIPFEYIAERVYDRYIVDLDEPYFHVGLIRGLNEEESQKVYDQVQKEREEFRVVRTKRLKEMQRQRELKRR